MAVLAFAVILIAAALPNLEFEPGVPLPSAAGRMDFAAPAPAPSTTFSANSLVAAMLIVLVLLLALAVGQALVRDGSRETILRGVLVVIAAFVLGSTALILLVACLRIPIKVDPATIQPAQIGSLVDGPPLESPPAELVWLVLIGLGAAVVLASVWALGARGRVIVADPVKAEAERALQDLMEGVDFKNVVVRCYAHMSTALQQERGIKLEGAMTARDFERLLAARGLEPGPVHELTQLLERRGTDNGR